MFALGNIVPKKTIDYLIRNSANPTNCQFAEEKARFALPGGMITTKLICGTYPNWAEAVPKNVQPFLKIERRKLVAALKRINSFRNGYLQVGTAITMDEDSIALSSGSSTEHKFCESVPATVLTADAEEFGINSKFLQSTCKAFADCDTLTLSRAERGDPSKQKYFTGEPINVTGDNSDLQVTIMPMRV